MSNFASLKNHVFGLKSSMKEELVINNADLKEMDVNRRRVIGDRVCGNLIVQLDTFLKSVIKDLQQK